MSSFKFSTTIILFFMALTSNAMFSDNDCIQSNFTSEIIHKADIFGLLERKLVISKDGCQIDISHEKFKYLKKSWTIDICRGPVHLKKTLGSVDVIKRIEMCDKSRDEFCKEYQTLKKIIQDDGLIFAQGEKENLSSDHGRVYCSFLVLNAYLNDGVVFNKNSDFTNHLFRTYSPDHPVEKSPSQTEAASSLDPNAAPEDF